LEERGISLDKLAEATKLYDVDRFDLLCHIAFNAPLRTRRERADILRKEKKDFFDQYSPIAQEILDEILDKYIHYGADQFKIPDILKITPINKHGNIIEIADIFGGPEKLRNTIHKMQSMLYC
jgi:type I restriction enzyme, R subunit